MSRARITLGTVPLCSVSLSSATAISPNMMQLHGKIGDKNNRGQTTVSAKNAEIAKNRAPKSQRIEK